VDFDVISYAVVCYCTTLSSSSGNGGSSVAISAHSCLRLLLPLGTFPHFVYAFLVLRHRNSSLIPHLLAANWWIYFANTARCCLPLLFLLGTFQVFHPLFRNTFSNYDHITRIPGICTVASFENAWAAI